MLLMIMMVGREGKASQLLFSSSSLLLLRLITSPALL
jgi:hypothetical protein